MSKDMIVTQEELSEVAESMIEHYVHDLLSVDELVGQIKQSWQKDFSGMTPDRSTLESLARGLCNQALYEACRLSGGVQRDLAFTRLSEYLEHALEKIGRTFRSTSHEMREEIIQQTLLEIVQNLQCERSKLAKPTTFLSWAFVILRRQFIHSWHRERQVEVLSLEREDTQKEPQVVEMVDNQALDPLAVMLGRELRAELYTAIAALRNPNYREVLLKTYFSEMEACELAALLRVEAKDIHLWHHRALQALRKRAPLYLWSKPTPRPAYSL